MTDPISDMLIRIKNAYLMNHHIVVIPLSKVKLKIAEILKKESYIVAFEKIEIKKKQFIKLRLKYIKSKSAITGLKRISKPGRRVYVDKNYSLLKIGGIGIISTSSGVKTIKEAKKEGIGGEILCEIW